MPEFLFRGLKAAEVQALNRDQFVKLIPSRSRRALKRGLSHSQKHLLADLLLDLKGFHRTQARDMVILPEMLNAKIGVHNGKEYVSVTILPEMLGHRLGEFVMTRKPIKHSAPGFGATRSSKYIPLK